MKILGIIFLASFLGFVLKGAVKIDGEVIDTILGGLMFAGIVSITNLGSAIPAGILK